jgi:hypothetical protein
MAKQTMFAGLVYDEYDNLVDSAVVGGEAHYIIDDDGFLRHIDAEVVDRQVLGFFLDQLEENKDLAVEQALRMLGSDDLLTKAAVDASLRNVNMEQIIAQGVPTQARDMLGMLGFRVVIDVHGDLVRLDQPAAPDDSDE